jgi:hypothetical protein
MEKGIQGVDGGLLQPETILDAEETHVHIDDLPEGKGGFLKGHT